MKLTVKPKAPRKISKPLAARPKPNDDPTWWFTWQPPTETEWQQFVREARASGSKILNQILDDQPAALTGVNNQPQTKPF